MKVKRPTKLFGLHKATVDEFLKKLDQFYRDDLRQLQDELEELTRKNTELERSRISLQAELSKLATSDVFTKAVAGLPSMVSAIQAQVVKETDNLRMKSEEELHALDQAIIKIKADIQKGTRLFDTFIQHFSKGIEDLGQLPETLLIENELKPDTQTNELFEPLPPHEDFIVRMEEPQVVGFSTFWEGSERVLAQPVSRLTRARENQSEEEENNRAPSTSENVEEINQRVVNPIDRNNTPSLNRTASVLVKENQSQEGENTEPSEGIKQEIDLIKRRYIVGKVAGSTLYDLTGNLIIEKGQPITDESVDQANLTGQLSDLIVHMRLPGLGE